MAEPVRGAAADRSGGVGGCSRSCGAVSIGRSGSAGRWSWGTPGAGGSRQICRPHRAAGVGHLTPARSLRKGVIRSLLQAGPDIADWAMIAGNAPARSRAEKAMFIHSYIAEQRDHDLIAATATARLARAARSKRTTRPRLPRVTHPVWRLVPRRTPRPSASIPSPSISPVTPSREGPSRQCSNLGPRSVSLQGSETSAFRLGLLALNPEGQKGGVDV
jgi:hypothetical protein